MSGGDVETEKPACESAPCVALRNELWAIFGRTFAHEGESEDDTLLRRINEVTAGNVRQAKYVQHLHESVTGPLDLLIKELEAPP